MLFKQNHLKGINEGRLSLAFRKWKRPMVKKGSLQKTTIGQIEILEISEVGLKDINLEDAVLSGHNDLDSLLKLLSSKEGNIYKIHLRYHSPDPRLALREKTEITEEEFEIIKSKLDKMDKFSKQGIWTKKILMAIKDNPELLAQKLADQYGYEKIWLKPNIRKLKNLGLTISHGVGYSLSPRGITVLKQL